MTFRTRRVLVIEDNALNLELVSGVLESLDCDIIPAASAEAGLELARAVQPDLILLDMRLPGMSGEEADSAPTPRCGHCRSSPSPRRQCRATKPARCAPDSTHIVSKPIDNRRLRDLVRGYLYGPGPT